MFNYNPRLLRVNLSSGKISEESILLEDSKLFIGGRGISSRHLYEDIEPGTDPLGEHNRLNFATGLLAGTQVQGCSRWIVSTKSPLTGCFARASAGADFGAWMRFAGYDLIIIEGKAEKPVYLLITPEGCRIEEAREIWGLETGAAQEWLVSQHGRNVRTACIGPAGENLVKYAAVVSGKRTASRCGVGAVMGSKNLKAISIIASRRLNLYDPEGLQQLAREQIRMLQENPVFREHKETGTTDGSTSRNALGVFPVRNFRYGQQIEWEKFTGREYRKLRVANVGCYSCPARCGKVHTVTSGLYTGATSEGPEYESMWAFTGTIDNSDIGATIAADSMCDNLGLDSISTGSTIGMAYELYEKGIITKADTDGLELVYSDPAPLIALIQKIAHREGFGDILAEGSRIAAKKIGRGAEYYAMQVKGLELAAYEPRGLKATGYGYATSNIGASHGNGSLAFQEWGMPVPRAVDRFADDGKADIVAYNQDSSALSEVSMVCAFFNSFGPWYPTLIGKMLVAATGIQEFGDMRYLRKAGERIVNLERAFNAREGINRADDTLPERFRSEPLRTHGAPGDGQMVTRLDKFLDDYYDFRGWTRYGIPSREKLQELGLGFVVKDMEPLYAKYEKQIE